MFAGVVFRVVDSDTVGAVHGMHEGMAKAIHFTVAHESHVNAMKLRVCVCVRTVSECPALPSMRVRGD